MPQIFIWRISLGYKSRWALETCPLKSKLVYLTARREAETTGLLHPESTESLHREEVRRRCVDSLFTATDRLANLATPALTDAEVEAEIIAARQSRAGYYIW